jgi:hypothetical protein
MMKKETIRPTRYSRSIFLLETIAPHDKRPTDYKEDDCDHDED